MAIKLRSKQWRYFPSDDEWEETEPTERVRRCAKLMVEVLGRYDRPLTQREQTALRFLKRALAEETY